MSGSRETRVAPGSIEVRPNDLTPALTIRWSQVRVLGNTLRTVPNTEAAVWQRNRTAHPWAGPRPAEGYAGCSSFR